VERDKGNMEKGTGVGDKILFQVIMGLTSRGLTS